MRHTQLKVLIFILIVGCQSKPQESNLKELDPVSKPNGQSTSVPVSLWSPAQRKATAGYYFMAGEQSRLRDKDPTRAHTLISAAYNLDPNPFLAAKLIQTRVYVADQSDVLLDARRMTLLYPKDAELRFLYGSLLANAGDVKEASAQLERCIDNNPRHEAAHLLLAEIYQNTDDFAKAIVVVRELTEKNPGSLQGWSILSRLLLTHGRAKEALVPARRAYEMNSHDPIYAQVYAIALQMNQKTKQALAIYEQLYRLDPTDDNTSARMVALYREIGNLETALTLLEGMEKKSEAIRPAILMQKVLILWELNRNDQALKSLKSGLVTFPESDRLLYLAGFAMERLKKPAEGLPYYEKITAKSHLRQEADLRRLDILQDLNRQADAFALAEMLLKGERISWETYGMVSQTYSHFSDHKKALSVLEEGVKAYPDEAKLLFYKGMAQEKMEDVPGAIATMRLVLAKDPLFAPAMNYLGYLFAERKENLDEAEELLKKAIELKPNDGYYLDSLGWVYYQKGNLKKAKELIEKSLEIQSDEGVIYEHLGDIYQASGDAGSAKTQYQKALKMRLDEKDKQRIQEKLNGRKP